MPTTPKPEATCFVAGVLIHTKEGLTPIEKIKAGDYVLSKPESGQGGLSFKRVTRTFVHENASDIHLVTFGYFAEKEGKREGVLGDRIFVTGNHPFYGKDGKWRKAWDLGCGAEVQLMLGHYASTYREPVYQTHQPDVGWVPDCDDEHQISVGNMRGSLIEFGTSGFKEKGRTQDSLGLPEGFPKFSRTVYNIEVEDYHTYFVGRLGVWAHNKGGMCVCPTKAAPNPRIWTPPERKEIDR